MNTIYLYDVSIILVNYNSLNLIDNCLKSLIEYSKGFSFEIIVIDNATTSGDVKNITDFYPQVKLIKNETNRGFASANNQGFKIAKGKYILILNNDTLFIENSIKLLLDFVESYKEEIMVGCKLLNADGSRQISLVDFDNPWNSFTENFFLYKLFPRSKLFNKFYQNYYEYNKPIEVDVIKGAFIFCSNDTITKLTGFDEKYYFYSEETDLCYRFKKNGGKVIYFPNTSIIHIGGTTTDKIPWFAFKNKCISKLLLYLKHYKGIRFFSLVVFHFIGLFIRIPVYLIFGILTRNKGQLLKSYYYLKQLFIYPKRSYYKN